MSRKQGVWFNFLSRITGNLDEAEDEAEASLMNLAKTVQSDKVMHINRGSLAGLRN